MGKRDELIEKYADDLRNKCGMTPDMDDAWSEAEERNRKIPTTPVKRCIENRK